MRILLDQNLSPKLVQRLADVIPGLESVYDHDLIAASDPFLFDWARQADFAAVISADRDLVHLVEQFGGAIRSTSQSNPHRAMRFLVRRH